MSTMKGSLTTLNRWWGKKNKEKVTPNGSFSKSSTNLSISATNLNEPSQLEYNRITPLPAATSNAPFEQTFRITVLLPKDQLYVCRLGARVPLSKLLELVCENKLLDPEKYEFRNPVDASQVYNCELTIGAVGLSEIRLCNKSESYDSFNADEVIKLHRTNIIRDSLSSSEFSSRNSKSLTTKTPSPYSSSNSLNSMDSTGMNYTRTPVSPTKVKPTLHQQPATLTRQISNTSTLSATAKIAAPPRKKRAAPRPPSQMVIPEKSTLETNTDVDVEQTIENLKNNAALPRKNYYVSTPNLTTAITTLTAQNGAIDCNGNMQLNGAVQHDHSEQLQLAEQQVKQMNARNLHTGSVQDLTSGTPVRLPEPSPRKRVVPIKKKASAPAPPPRGINGAMYSDNDDEVSISSNTGSQSETATPTTPTTPLTPATPQTPSTRQTFNTPLTTIAPSTTLTTVTPAASTALALPRVDVPPDSVHAMEQSLSYKQASPTPMKRETISTTITTSTTISQTAASTTTTTTQTLQSNRTENAIELPKPVPRQTSTTLLNVTQSESIKSVPKLTTQATSTNVSKVLLNRTPTPEPRSLSTEPPELDLEDDDNRSKQADSGIGELMPSPVPDSLPSEGSAHECKSTFESSSDDDEIIKVYNFKLCKTVKPLGEHKTLDDLTLLAADGSGNTTPAASTQTATPSLTDATSWNFTIPISPPPNFADGKNSSKEVHQHQQQHVLAVASEINQSTSTDVPIQPKIKERPVLNFDAINTDSLERKPKAALQMEPTTPMPSPATPLNEIVGELSAIISENRMDSLIRQAKAQPDIEAAKPNTLTNFSIGAIVQQHQQKQSSIEAVTTTTTTRTTVLNATPSSPPTMDAAAADDSKLYRKRGSVTNLTSLQQQRKSLTRADSFQLPSTHAADITDVTTNGLNSRSSSHLCLTKIEQNGLQISKRRSSSELSIGESPSLLSLEVIKGILNSRKNSLVASSDGETKVVEEQTAKAGIKVTTPTETIAKRETVSAAAKRFEAAQPITTETTVISRETAQPRDIPKTYRYSGPPSINFSTWSERPKVQVEIKNEGDYIFGGQQATKKLATSTTTNTISTETTKAIPRNYRVSTPAGTYNTNAQFIDTKIQAPATAPKPDSTTARMGIPDKEFTVPITVKPLPDVAFESNPIVPQQANKVRTEANIMKVEYNVNKQGNPATLPRNFGNKRFSTPPPATAVTLTTTVAGQALLRTTSINKADNSDKRMSVPYDYRSTATSATTTTTTVPFGQGTLRKTGFKEKILAKEQEKAQTTTANNNVAKENIAPFEQQQQQTQQPTTIVATKTFHLNTKANNVTSTKVNTSTNPSVTTVPLVNGHATTTATTAFDSTESTATTTTTTTTKKAFQSAKLELKLQNNVNSTNTALHAVRLQSPKSAPVAPPPPPFIAGVTLRSVKSMTSKATSPTVNGDSRDALLDEIRNFKRKELNRV